MIDRREMFDNIEPKDIAVLAAPPLELIYRPMGPFLFAIGVAVWVEAGLKERLDHIAEGMMHNPISEGGCADESSFRLFDLKVGIRSRSVAAIA